MMLPRSQAIILALRVAGVAFALIAIPAQQVRAWDFNLFWDAISNGDEPLPTKDQAFAAYALFYTRTLTYGVLVVPQTLIAVIKRGKGVTLEEQKAICTESGGDFASRLDASPCRNGQVVLTPSEDAGQPVQIQSCNTGQGYKYTNVCIHRDRVGKYYRDDGPSIPGLTNETLPGERNYRLFVCPAGQVHDYCYHHGGLTYKYDKIRCNDDFYSLMFKLCTATRFENWASWFSITDCVNSAISARAAVKNFGDDAWKATSSFVDYERKHFPQKVWDAVITGVVGPLLH